MPRINPHGAVALADYLRDLNKEIILVLGISDDKDVAGIIRPLAPLAKKIMLTQARHRGSDCSRLKEEAIKYNMPVLVEKDVRKAVKKAIGLTRPDGAVVITGSIFVAGEARELWHGKN